MKCKKGIVSVISDCPLNDRILLGIALGTDTEHIPKLLWKRKIVRVNLGGAFKLSATGFIYDGSPKGSTFLIKA